MGAGRGLSASSAVLHFKAWRARGAGQIAGAACWAAQALQGAQVCASGRSALASKNILCCASLRSWELGSEQAALEPNQY